MMEEYETPGKKRILRFRFRHRIAHIFVSLAVMYVSTTALLGYAIGRPWHTWTGLAMAPNTAVCLLALAVLELFEAFNLES